MGLEICTKLIHGWAMMQMHALQLSPSALFEFGIKELITGILDNIQILYGSIGMGSFLMAITSRFDLLRVLDLIRILF